MRTMMKRIEDKPREIKRGKKKRRRQQWISDLPPQVITAKSATPIIERGICRNPLITANATGLPHYQKVRVLTGTATEIKMSKERNYMMNVLKSKKSKNKNENFLMKKIQQMQRRSEIKQWIHDLLPYVILATAYLIKPNRRQSGIPSAPEVARRGRIGI